MTYARFRNTGRTFNFRYLFIQEIGLGFYNLRNRRVDSNTLKALGLVRDNNLTRVYVDSRDLQWGTPEDHTGRFKTYPYRSKNGKVDRDQAIKK